MAESFRVSYYDRLGNEIPLGVWAKLVSDQRYVVVKQTELDNSYRVSTVWLGLDHDWTGEGPPIVFESMVFGSNGSVHMQRYSTEQEALDGHEQLIKTWGTKPSDPPTDAGVAEAGSSVAHRPTQK